MTDAERPVKAPFRLPRGWLRYFGYPGPRRYVGLHWNPYCGEACHYDGRAVECGACESRLLLDLVGRADVRAWLDRHGVFVGDGDREATHWLVIDRTTDEVFAARTADAALYLDFQTLPDEPG